MDQMFQLLWGRYRTWDDTSAHLKATNASWKRNVLVLTMIGTTLATLGPFAGSGAGRVVPMLGAAALALATYFGKQLLDTKHEEKWTRARAAAEAYKSEAQKYLVQTPPYDGANRTARLKARMDDVAKVTKDIVADDIPPDRMTKDIPQAPWTISDYLTKRLNQQVTWYRDKAKAHSEAMATGRTIALSLGGLSVLLSAVTGATTQGATLSAAVLGIVTTAGGAIGAYFQAGHYEALALRYRETAEALRSLEADFKSSTTPQSPGDLVSTAEAIMQAENAAWLTELTAKAVQ
jgi:hypothetical protein